MADGQEVAMLRITLIGARESGKTSMINVFVNNTYYSNYTPTESLTLYHKYIHLASKKNSGAENEPDVFILLEIEDTYGCDRQKSKLHDLHSKDSIYNPWHPLQRGDLELEMDRRRRDIEKAKGLFGSEMFESRPEWCHHPEWKKFDLNRKIEHPLGLCELSAESEQEYRPLTKNRMAYFFVFDANKMQSLKKIQQEYAEQQHYMERKRIAILPLSYAVGTQVDKCTLEQEKVRIEAEQWTKQAGMALRWVSALKRENIDEVFHSACEHIHGTTALWVFQHSKPRGGEQDEKKKAEGCCLQ